MDKKVEDLQNELKLLKNEIKETLTDIRGFLLTNVQNPFPVDITREPPSRQGGDRSASVSATQGLVTDEQVRQQPSAAVQGWPQEAPTQSSYPVPGTGNMAGAPTGPSPTLPVNPVRGETLADRVEPTVKTSEYERAKGQGEELVRTDANGHRVGPDIATAAPEAKSGATNRASVFKSEQTNERGQEDGSGSSTTEDGLLELDAEPQKASREQEDKGSTSSYYGESVDPLTVVTLATWIEDGSKRLGRERMRSVVELYSVMGGLSPQLKDVLLRLASLDEGNGSGAKVSLRECLRVLLDLDNLVLRGHSDRRRPLVL